MKYGYAVYLFTIGFLLSGCEPAGSYIDLKGEVFGTYYSISYRASKNFQKEIDSIFQAYTKAVSKYDPASEISDFNRTGKVRFRSPYLHDLSLKAKQFHELTNGALEPTLMPIIEAWGFGVKKGILPDNAQVDSLMEFVDFESVVITDSTMYTVKKGVTIDLNSIGEGFGIDLIGRFLEENKIADYKIEIGGEVLCQGKNPKGEFWRIGIENPVYTGDAERFHTILSVENQAISTSGSYRHFFVDSLGVKRSHLIDPLTGYPIAHQMISVTVKSANCVTADGFATACMVVGLEAGKDFITRLEGVEALFIFEKDGKTESWKSPGF